jgi:hypothetical protein
MNKLLIITLLISLLLLTGCAKTIEEITANDDYVDTSVSVRGTVEASLKIGELSGYNIVDKNGDKIIVYSTDLPKEGSRVTAKGTLKKGLLGRGYYIDAKN